MAEALALNPLSVAIEADQVGANFWLVMRKPQRVGGLRMPSSC